MFWNKKSVAVKDVVRKSGTATPSAPSGRVVATKGPTAKTPAQKEAPGRVVDVGASAKNEDTQVRNFAGLRFATGEIETTQDLAKIFFHQIINERVKLGVHMYARIAVAQVNASSKTCVFFVDKEKVSSDDIRTVVELLKNHGYELVSNGVQGYYAMSSLVIALSQGHLNSGNLAVERDIARDSTKNSLMASFTDIISWAYVNKADDLDFVVDISSSKSQVAFKIGGRYIRPERHLLPTDTLIQMLGIAWQKSTGGAAAQFEIKTEQQAQVSLDLPKSAGCPDGARVRLRWSGMANDKGTVVTMRLQRLGESARIRSLDQAGYVDSQMEILKRVIHSEGGMVVFSGVVGSGKSTSLVQLISMLPNDIKIVSIEDPVELDIKNAYQKTVTRDLMASGQDPAMLAATRALYRSAMDVLYLGEIRDAETGLIARQVAESGHSVYTTTHARSALGIVDRFASPAIGVPRDVLATPDILKLLVYQALLPTTCPHCGKTPDEYAKSMNLRNKELTALGHYYERLYRLYGIEPNNFKMRDPRGCPHCIKPELPDLNGFEGRTVVSELIEPDEQMLEYILAGNNIEVNRYWRSLATPDYTDSNLIGKTTMECAIYKASKGLIDPREIEPRFMSFETAEAKKRFSEKKSVARHSNPLIRAIA